MLPNNKNIVPVARQVPGLTDLHVDVVPTAAVVEALAALVVYDPDDSMAENVGGHGAKEPPACAPARSPRRCATASPSAARSRRATGSPITRDGIVAAVGSALDAAIALLDALVDDDSELVTVLVGEGASDARRHRAG